MAAKKHGSESVPPDGVHLVNPRRAAAILAISTRKLWTETAARRIPVVKIGRCVRYDVRDLQAYIDAQKSGGGR